MRDTLGRYIRRAVDLRPGEGAALIWSCAYFFFVLCAYYILRPIRDEMGVAGGVDNLALLFTGTLIGMLIVHPIFTTLVSRMPRSRFVPFIYRFFILNLIIFFLVFHAADAGQSVWVGRIFFIWVSVFNLFVISVFWSFMTDIYRPSQSKRLFGMVAVGGTAGAILGSSITATLVSQFGPINLLLVSAVLLEVAGRASRFLEGQEGMLMRAAAAEGDPGQEMNEGGDTNGGVPPDTDRAGSPVARSKEKEIIGGHFLDGIRHVARSPYLLGIAALMLLFTIASTFLYFQQAAIIAHVFQDDPAGRTRTFANIDLLVNMLTLGTQLFLTGRILRWFGVGVSLAFLPVVSFVGFGILGTAPVLLVLVVFQILRRAGNFAIQRPAREVLYTVLARTDKYKAKNFNDTFVYRAGDQLGAWSYTFMSWLGLGLSGLAFTMLPISALWFLLALWLGRRHGEYHQADRVPAEPAPASQELRV